MALTRENKVIFIGMLIILAFEWIYIFLPYQVNPYSLLMVIPTLLIGSYFGETVGLIVGGSISSLLPPIVFFLCSKHAININKPIPKMSIIIGAILMSLSIAFALFGYQVTVNYTSLLRANALIIQSIGGLIILMAFAIYKRNNMTINQSILWHFCGCIWLGCAAFPWYGELM